MPEHNAYAKAIGWMDLIVVGDGATGVLEFIGMYEHNVFSKTPL